MALSPREREILALLRAHPLLDAAGLAQRLGTTKGAIAVALSSLTQKGEIVGRGYLLRDDPWAVVVGARWDIKARSSAPVRLGTSNPGTVSQTLGGVGRNIAEGIARLGPGAPACRRWRGHRRTRPAGPYRRSRRASTA